MAFVEAQDGRTKDQLLVLANEQAALGRVAELVARGTQEEQLFDAVTREVTAMLGDEGVVADILHTDRPAWIGCLAARSGLSDVEADLRLSVSVPIVVDESVWGVLRVTATERSLSAGAEPRLQQFADLVGVALGNSQTRARVEQLANQHSALRQVTELAARDAPAEDVLHAVAVQASHLADVDFTTILRYEPDGSVEIMALSGAPADLAIGVRNPNSGDGVTQRVWRTKRSARLSNLLSVESEWTALAHDLGFTTSAAVPIVIRGELWGTLVVHGQGEPLTEATEDSLTSFAGLAATAISNAQARQDLRALADEQAAFRRVAELVAHGTALDLVFGAVTSEASKLLGGLITALQRLDPDGSTTTVAAHTPSAAPTENMTADVAVTVTVEGRVWGVLTTRSVGDVLSSETEERLSQFAELAAAAIANAENKAKLTASRARVVATADETRRRLQRDVHDGAQQRLVQTIMTLKLALHTAVDGSISSAQVAEALHHAERANRELRDLVHGILPASLTRGGLRAGLESLISDTSIPVQLKLTAPPLPSEIETTAYFVVAEGLTNVVKHARATRADVSVDFDGATLLIQVSDDGVGGADPAAGGGLTGLADRIEAFDGVLTVTSDVGTGTTLRASFPFTSQRG